MGINYQALIYAPNFDQFARPIVFLPVVSQPAAGSIIGRGIFHSDRLNFPMEDGSLFVDQETSLDILESEFPTPPQQFDRVQIPQDGPEGMMAEGEFEITTITRNGGGETNLILRKWVPPAPHWTVIGHASSIQGAASAAVDTTGADLLICAVTWTAAESSAADPDDSLSNVWTPGIIEQGDPNGQGVRIWYCENPTVGRVHTFNQQGVVSGVMCVLAVKGSAASPYDQSNGQSFAGDSVSTARQPGSVMPTGEYALCVLFVGIDGPSGSTFSVDSDFMITDAIDVAAYQGGVLAYLIQETAAAVDPTLTRSVPGAVGATDNAVIATFTTAQP